MIRCALSRFPVETGNIQILTHRYLHERKTEMCAGLVLMRAAAVSLFFHFSLVRHFPACRFSVFFSLPSAVGITIIPFVIGTICDSSPFNSIRL
jgi:hypothetical protein